LPFKHLFELPMLPELLDRLSRHQPPVPEGARVTASVLVPITDARAPELILTRRSTALKSHAGEVAFPGGKLEPDDPDLLYTALRESEEEIGLAPARVRTAGPLAIKRTRAGMWVAPFVGLVPPDVPLVANPGEIESIFRVPLAHFLDTPVQLDHPVRWMGHEYLMPTWRHGDYMIWGLTAYIIVDLLNTAFEAGIALPGPQPIRASAG
jgi:8-oxo-dGTP pyrophosphatase MutT (NUDIX family)